MNNLSYLSLVTIPAFNDNYLWLLHNGTDAIVVDPGDAVPVLAKLDELKLKLKAILVTHHHADHVGGVDILRETTGAQVYGPAFEVIPEPLARLGHGDTVSVLGIDFTILEVPGHTSGHIAYFHKGSALHPKPILFCGDTLFSGGSGRLFEGTPTQMLASLQSLMALPDDTLICCAHEYTLSNLKFALAVDGSNADLVAYEKQCQELRAKNIPTIPSLMRIEKKINPFLRSHTPQVVASVKQFDPSAESSVDVFAALRQWKNSFR